MLGTTGLIAFYKGMAAAGALSIDRPDRRRQAPAIPVIWGLAHGDHPSGYQELGFAAALIGVVLASFERRPEAARLAAGVGWAVIAIARLRRLLHPDARGEPRRLSLGRVRFPPYLDDADCGRLAGAPTSSARRADLPVLASIGILDTGGNVFFAAASAKGLVSVVSILASLYPVVTVLLARAVLHERVHRSQELGIALALAGIVLISAG